MTVQYKEKQSPDPKQAEGLPSPFCAFVANLGANSLSQFVGGRVLLKPMARHLLHLTLGLLCFTRWCAAQDLDQTMPTPPGDLPTTTVRSNVEPASSTPDLTVVTEVRAGDLTTVPPAERQEVTDTPTPGVTTVAPATPGRDPPSTAGNDLTGAPTAERMSDVDAGSTSPTMSGMQAQTTGAGSMAGGGSDSMSDSASMSRSSSESFASQSSE